MTTMHKQPLPLHASEWLFCRPGKALCAPVLKITCWVNWYLGAGGMTPVHSSVENLEQSIVISLLFSFLFLYTKRSCLRLVVLWCWGNHFHITLTPEFAFRKGGVGRHLIIITTAVEIPPVWINFAWRFNWIRFNFIYTFCAFYRDTATQMHYSENTNENWAKTQTWTSVWQGGGGGADEVSSIREVGCWGEKCASDLQNPWWFLLCNPSKWDGGT